MTTTFSERQRRACARWRRECGRLAWCGTIQSMFAGAWPVARALRSSTCGEVDHRVAEHLAALHPHLADRAGGRRAAIDIEQVAMRAVGVKLGWRARRPAGRPRPRPRPRSTIAPAPSPNSTQVARSSQSRMRLKVSAPITSAHLAMPVRSIESAIAERVEEARAHRRRRRTRRRRCSRARPAPVRRWPERSGRGSRSRARSGRPRSRSIPAAASAARAASVASVPVVSPSPAMWRWRMPVRSTIHSSLVSTVLGQFVVGHAPARAAPSRCP